MKLIIEVGVCLFLRLWISFAGTAFGKVPSTSNNRTETTLFSLHAVVILWMVAVVDLPCLSLKCVLGNSWCCSTIWLKFSATIEVRILAIVDIKAIGQYALGVL